MIPLIIGAGLIAVVALNDDDDENFSDEETSRRTLSESELPDSVKRKLEIKRRDRE